MVFCNNNYHRVKKHYDSVTILILIDGFLQYVFNYRLKICSFSHNPYFNRWFSAIKVPKCPKFHFKRHNPYFNRWFSAISNTDFMELYLRCHNPYFNRWFSAMSY